MPVAGELHGRVKRKVAPRPGEAIDPVHTAIGQDNDRGCNETARVLFDPEHGLVEGLLAAVEKHAAQPNAPDAFVVQV